jgi:hypothetical protein
MHDGRRADPGGGAAGGQDPVGRRRGLAVAAFAVLFVLVLRAVLYLPEPDDYAYRTSIVAMTDGHLFTLSGRRPRRLPSS